MTSFWIFPVKDSTIGQERMTGVEIYEQRMKDRYWGIRESAQNRKELRKGDLVIFYLAGKGGQIFLGTCELDSEYHALKREERKKLVYGTFFTADHGVDLTNIEEWKTSVSIRPLLEILEFTKSLSSWWSYLQGSIRRICEEDYFTIVSMHESDEIKELSDGPAVLTETSRFTMAKRRGRDVAFRNKVRRNYGLRCAVCGKARFTRLKYPEVESCHIYPKKENGKDDMRNGLTLCKLHHWAFENGLFSIKDDYSIVIEERIRNDASYDEITRFENKKIRLPLDYRPAPIYLQAHRKLHNYE